MGLLIIYCLWYLFVNSNVDLIEEGNDQKCFYFHVKQMFSNYTLSLEEGLFSAGIVPTLFLRENLGINKSSFYPSKFLFLWLFSWQFEKIFSTNFVNFLISITKNLKILALKVFLELYFCLILFFYYIFLIHLFYLSGVCDRYIWQRDYDSTTVLLRWQ